MQNLVIQSDKNLISIQQPEISSKNLATPKKNPSISLLDIYPIQELKIQKKKNLNKKKDVRKFYFWFIK